jgi:hypothetical protein
MNIKRFAAKATKLILPKIYIETTSNSEIEIPRHIYLATAHKNPKFFTFIPV